MRIQTRLFLGTAALVLTLMGTQWLLYSRQLQSIEDDVSNVATTVGTGVLTAEREFFGGVIAHDANGIWVTADRIDMSTHDAHEVSEHGGEAQVRMMVVPKELDEELDPSHNEVLVERRIDGVGEVAVEERLEWTAEGGPNHSVTIVGVDGEVHTLDDDFEFPEDVKRLKRLMVKVEPGEKRHDRFLVVSEDEHDLHRIPIPVAPAVKRVEESMREGALVGGGLLIVGLFAAAVLSRRLTSPLRALADGTEAVGRGDLGMQVPVSATGEVGDLQRSFNRMSERLAELEAERELWQRREHLAQLGDLSRGLAHTLRNPLHTLGLAVEELANGEDARGDLVATSRAQIRRIDRWLRSFLALGAEESAQAQEIDLNEIVNGVALESVQQGADVRVKTVDEDLRVEVVPGAVRAALSNLIENAAEVSPEDDHVNVTTSRDGAEAVVTVIDRGPGLPEEVRERLFAPHVTTKVGGSGMGLFLARQLVVGMHQGELELGDGDGGGTTAVIRLPLAHADDRSGTSN